MKCLLLNLFLLFTVQSVSAQADQGTWTNLFDGKTLNGWRKAGEAEYSVESGQIVGKTVPASKNSFLISEAEYGDFILELEVRIDDSTSNSGIQLRSHQDGKGKVFGYQYELDPSSRKWTAGIYDEGRRDWLYPLSLNSPAQDVFRLQQFNKVRVECFQHTVRTWINGVGGACLVDTFDSKGFIALQVHAVKKEEEAGKKIYFRNIRIKPIQALSEDFPKGIYVVNKIPNDLSSYEKEDGWQLLFDGKTSDGWVGAYKDSFPAKGWEIKDGTISVLSSGGAEATNGGDIVTKDEFSVFDLSFDFKLTSGANSGVKYFVTLSENNQGSAIGLEYQILDDKVHPDAKMGRDGNRTLASLYDLIAAKKLDRFVHEIGEWNTGRVIVYPNNHVEHYLNGVKVLEYDRGSAAYRELVATSKYKIWKDFGEAQKGRVLLQDHGNAVSYRSVKIRSLN